MERLEGASGISSVCLQGLVGQVNFLILLQEQRQFMVAVVNGVS